MGGRVPSGLKRIPGTAGWNYCEGATLCPGRFHKRRSETEVRGARSTGDGVLGTPGSGGPGSTCSLPVARPPEGTEHVNSGASEHYPPTFLRHKLHGPYDFLAWRHSRRYSRVARDRAKPSRPGNRVARLMFIRSSSHSRSARIEVGIVKR